MKFWLDMGVDGFRLDAVPYLVEREGTNCENLPETHEVLKELRRRLDETIRAGFCWRKPTSGRRICDAYFGDGDEFHMAFHFPLMPRMFMAPQAGRPQADHGNPAADPGNSRLMPVGPVPAQP